MTNDLSTTRLPLRVGLLVDSFVQRRWICKIVEDIQASGIAEIVVVIKNAAQSPAQSRFKSYWRNRQYLLYTLYEKLDNRRVKVSPDAFAPTDLKPLVADVPVIEVTPEMKAYSDWFPAADIERIREFDLDVALSFGFRILKGDVLKIARHGIWSYHHGDNSVNRGGPAGFWEVMDGIPVTGSVLQILTEDLDNGPDLVQEPRDRPPPLPNDDSIPDGRLTFRWQWEKHTARLFPGIVLDDAYYFVGGYGCFIVHSVRGIDRLVFGLHRLTW